MLAYASWESKKMIEYTELKDKYKSIKEQENALTEQKQCKKSKKDQLLDLKLRGTLSKAGSLELHYINEEERCKSDHDDNIKQIEDRQDNEKVQADKIYESAIEKAKAIYKSAMDKAEKEYEASEATALKKLEVEKGRIDTAFVRAKSAYDKQLGKSIEKVNRVYDSKKESLEGRKETLEGEKSITTKTAAELMIEKQKREILKKMKEMIDGIDMARSQIPEKERDFVFDVPELPEPIVDAHVMPPTPVTQPVAPVAKPKRLVTEEQWMAMGEDATNQQLREQARMEKSIRPEYEVRPNPTPYGVIGIAKDVSKLYVKPARTEEDEDEEDDYDPEYVAKRREELKKMLTASA
jgi:hypothetical protein